MKVVKISCPNCGGSLTIDCDKKKDYCQYCGTPIMLDDEVKHVQLDIEEEVGYKFEKGRIRAHEEKIREEKEAQLRKDEEIRRKREEEIKRQKQFVEERKKANQGQNKKVLLIVTMVILGIVLFLMIFCCLGTSFFAKIFGETSNQTSNQLNETIINNPLEKKINSIDDIEENLIKELKIKADENINAFIKENSLDVNDFKDILELNEYVGYCFANDEEEGNEIFFIYQINNKTETIDNVNLRRFSDERPIFYYIGFKNIAKSGDGSFVYDEGAVEEPIEKVPDFTAKKTYANNMHVFSHPGYPLISLLFDDIENRFSKVEYNTSKEAMINAVCQESMNITNYADNIPHCEAMWFDDGYTDESGEYYTECMYGYTHFAFTDPTCLDYRIGSEYSKLSFTCGTWPGRYNSNSAVFIRVIDKDTFDVIYESENIVANKSIKCDVDVTNHKNIRIQFVQVGDSVEYSIIKDVVLSN